MLVLVMLSVSLAPWLRDVSNVYQVSHQFVLNVPQASILTLTQHAQPASFSALYVLLPLFAPHSLTPLVILFQQSMVFQ